MSSDQEDAAVLKLLTYCLKITGLKAKLPMNDSNKKRKFNKDLSDDDSGEEVNTSPATFTPKDIEESLIVHVDVSSF